VANLLSLWQTDEQAPLPDALSQLLERVSTGMSQAGDCMVTASLISSTMSQNWDDEQGNAAILYEPSTEIYDTMDGPSEEEAYLQGLCFPTYPDSDT
jgi:hypothetical protein